MTSRGNTPTSIPNRMKSDDDDEFRDEAEQSPSPLISPIDIGLHHVLDVSIGKKRKKRIASPYIPRKFAPPDKDEPAQIGHHNVSRKQRIKSCTP